MTRDKPPSGPYGMLAEYDTPEAVVSAAVLARGEGYSSLDAYSPFPVEGLAEALNFHKNRIPLVVFIGGLLGGLTGYFMQWYASVVSYPINVGGRPMHSWPMFLPITFEMTILCAAFAAVFGMLGLNGLPRPHHPVFGAPGFDRASRDRFFLCIFAIDPKYDAPTVRSFLETTSPTRVTEVDR